ncbi:hypothetical protein C8J31_13611 [Rhizobium sp. PP-CC-2G-626]|nr:hypothetical protein C8J31_13611 [Rhizobium sp. PP-CC-2G-626]
MAIHVFCDNSNVWLSSGTCRVENEPHVPSYLFRLHFRNLFSLVEGGREALTRELAGSLPPECEALWEYARENGYNTNLLHRVDDGIRVREQSVDEALHLKIANALLDHEGDQTLILMTGDGALSDIDTSFYQQAERALKRGWSVEQWSWKASRNGRYDNLVGMYSNRFRMKDFDDYYFQISFIKEGQQTLPDGTVIPVQGRWVKPRRG